MSYALFQLAGAGRAKSRKSYWGGFHADVTLWARPRNPASLGGRASGVKPNSGATQMSTMTATSTRSGGMTRTNVSSFCLVARHVLNGMISISTDRSPIIGAHSFKPIRRHPRYLRAAGLCRGLPGPPFGAIVFGRVATSSAASIPSSSPFSLWACRPSSSACPTPLPSAPAGTVILIALRLLQGLALGGNMRCGDYVAEHSPQGKRGYPRSSRPPRRSACSCRCW